ncbi:MAG: gamma-glutamyl-gamma-aminobutyrate hydrolase family protein, partial [Candidatus Dormibacteria bacterium]
MRVSVRTVAPSLRAVGWTDDGIVEAIDPAFAHPFFVCVQWHPEA